MYEKAYMQFLLNPDCINTEELFLQSAGLDKDFGRALGVLVSKAQSQVVAVRRGRTAGLDLSSHFRKLADIRDRLASIGGRLAESWAFESIPVFLAYIDLAKGRNGSAIEALGPLADSGNTSALWYRGLALIREGDLKSGIANLERGRRGFYRDRRAEGRGALLLALGDAYQLVHRDDDARDAYAEAARQPPFMDNLVAVTTARRKLAEPSKHKAPCDVHLV